MPLSDYRPVPEWADRDLSSELATLRKRGEGQELEYMGSFPQQARDLAKEIAAFATSNQGTILIGVSNDGSLVGVSDLADPSVRDGYLQRVEGLTKSMLRPLFTPQVKFAFDGGRAVLAIMVPKGPRPVYYCNQVPYIKHLTESRPAEPDEVIELIRQWLSTSQGRDVSSDSPLSHLLSALARTIFNILMIGDEADCRAVNPWFDLWRSDLGYAATDLRSLASEQIVVDHGMAQELLELAKALDAVTGMHMTMGSGQELKQLLERAVALADEIHRNRIVPTPLSEESITAINAILLSSSRRLRELVERAPALNDSGRTSDL